MLRERKPFERHEHLGLQIITGFCLSVKIHSLMSRSRKFFTGGSSKVSLLKKAMKGNREKGERVDVIHFQDGKIIQKLTYSKTTLEIDGKQISLHG